LWCAVPPHIAALLATLAGAKRLYATAEHTTKGGDKMLITADGDAQSIVNALKIVTIKTASRQLEKATSLHISGDVATIKFKNSIEKYYVDEIVSD
jgi:hypothetical protein